MYIPMVRATNVATFYQGPGYNKFAVFSTEYEAEDTDLDPIVSSTHMIPQINEDEVPNDVKDHTEY